MVRGVVSGVIFSAEFFRQDAGDVARPMEDAQYLDAATKRPVENHVHAKVRDREIAEIGVMRLMAKVESA
jgi:hypothetical protein